MGVGNRREHAATGRAAASQPRRVRSHRLGDPGLGAIIPAALGVDMGCGMIAVQTDLRAEDLPDSLDGPVDELGRSVPAGVGRGHRAGSFPATVRVLVTLRVSYLGIAFSGDCLAETSRGKNLSAF